MCPLCVLLLGALLYPGKGIGDQEEIFTRPGSDLLIPIRRHLTLNHTDRRRCDGFTWFYQRPSVPWKRIAEHRNCDLSDHRYFPNTRISVNGSLIISNVTLSNDGEYRVYIYNSTGDIIQDDYYIVYVEGNGVQEEIFTRPGSDLLIPIRHHLTLNHTDTKRCDGLYWFYQKPSGSWKIIAKHSYCNLSDYRDFPNTRISVNGSLIISNVTLRNDGIYRVHIHSIGYIIQEDFYTVHVEVPVLHIICLRNGSIRVTCRVEAGTKPNIHLSIIGESQGNYSTSANNITAIVKPPGPWNITCTVENGVSRSEESRAGVTCPVPVLHVMCLRNGSIRVTCRVEAGTKPNIYLSIIGESQGNYSTSANNITAIVKPPGPWNITCTVENGVSQSEESRAGVTCPEESRCGMLV